MQSELDVRDPEIASDVSGVDERKATLVAYLMNLLNNRIGLSAATAKDVLRIRPFEAERVVRSFLAEGWRLEPDTESTIHQIMLNPDSVKHLKVVSQPQLVLSSQKRLADAGGTDANSTHVVQENTDPAALLRPQNQYSECSERSRHPTGQYPSDFETFFQGEDGNWFVKFHKPMPCGGGYEQIDMLPTWLPHTAPFNREDGIRSYIEPTHEKSQIPPFWSTDKAKWERIEGKAYEWRRVPSPRQPEKQFARPKFILRGYDRNTHQMIRQYFYGSSWQDFERHLREFDINDKKSVEEYNRWSCQVMERNHFAYTKRPTREPWKPYEMAALRKYFNEFIRSEGLAKLCLKPDYGRAVEKVNEAREARDARGPRPALRDENAIVKQSTSDRYPPQASRLGIEEWRVFGQAVMVFREQHPDVFIPERLLKPKDAIPMDDIDQIANPKKRKAVDSDSAHSHSSDALGSKLRIALVEGKVQVTARVDLPTDFVDRLFGPDEAEDGKQEEGNAAENEVSGDVWSNPPSARQQVDEPNSDLTEPRQKRHRVS